MFPLPCTLCRCIILKVLQQKNIEAIKCLKFCLQPDQPPFDSNHVTAHRANWKEIGFIMVS